MAYLLGYQLQFTNVEEVTVQVNIYDTLSGTGTTTFTQLEGSDDPCHIFIVDNNESKFTPIRAKQAEIRFISTATENLNTFISAEDNRWFVEILVGGLVKFRGFLVLDDNDEDFLDSDASNVVTLIATDNLGLLKDEPLTKTDGKNPRGYFSIIQYISWCLQKTGLQLPINVVHNVKEQNDSTRIMFESCFFEAKTWEADINTSVDCYQVLSDLLSNDATLTQANGEWWIIRTDELQDDASINNKFTYLGLNNGTELFNTTQVIDPIPEILYFSNKSTFVKAQQPVKNIKLTFPYDSPKEIIDNIDFDRSDVDPFYTNTYVEDGITKTKKRYALEDWTIGRYSAANEVPGATTATAWIERIFVEDYEKERYAVVSFATESNPFVYIRSNPIKVGVKDRGVVSVDFRYDPSTVGSKVNPLAVILKGDNGVYYYALQGTGEWFNASSFGSAFFFSTSFNYTSEDMKKNWQTVAIDFRDLPASGELYIYLVAGYNNAGSGNPNALYQNLQFVYKPFINGSYQKYRSQYHKISQDLSTKKVYEQDVKISDSPRTLFKGAIFRYNGFAYVLADLFYDGKQFTGAVPDAIYLHPYGFNQAYAVWNQYNRVFRLFDFQLQGLNGADTYPDIIHKYKINENSEHSYNKVFMMLHYDQDLNLCEWKGVMMEVFDTTQAKDYDSAHEFKYVSER
jgi:hypothetical protein